MRDPLKPEEMTALVATDLGGRTVSQAPPSSVVTRMRFAASPAQVWQGLVFYEQISEPPPLHLRLLLPVPLGVEGRVFEVGSEAKCRYKEGYLVKRIVRIEDQELYEFHIIEQKLSMGGGIRLFGGRYVLCEVDDGLTEVSIETRYAGSRWPRWFWRPLEGLVCHSFHRCLLRSMRSKVESR